MFQKTFLIQLLKIKSMKNLMLKHLKQIENLRLEYQNFNFDDKRQDFKYQKFWLLAKKYGPNF